MNREGPGVARCTVERLMQRMHLQGVSRDKVMRGMVPDKAAVCPLDKVNRKFKSSRPNALWVSDFTYVSAWQRWMFVAFVVDVFARRIVGWQVSNSLLNVAAAEVMLKDYLRNTNNFYETPRTLKYNFLHDIPS